MWLGLAFGMLQKNRGEDEEECGGMELWLSWEEEKKEESGFNWQIVNI